MHNDATSGPRVVIIGCGFAGLETAKALASAAVDVTLVDRRNFHLFQPLLYQVATAALSPGDIAWPIRSIFARQSNVRPVMMEITAVDSEARTVTDGAITLRYDYLVIATGATHAYFGHDEWEPFAPGLKTIDDARLLRARLLRAFERAELCENDQDRARLLTIVIVGGGATGVEMAGAAAELAHRTLACDFRSIDPSTARVILIEAGSRLLPAFPERLSADAERSLLARAVVVEKGSAVTSCDRHGIAIGDRRIDAGTVIWAAGVQALPAYQWFDAPHDRAGRVIVGEELQLAGHPEIFIVGDTASVVQAGKPVPGIAPAAKQMGQHVARVIAARIAGREAPLPFHYRHQGDLATIGRNSAVVAIGKLRLRGFVGWMFWSLVHILFLIGFRNRVIVGFNWAWSWITQKRGVRLIPESMSLHDRDQ
jgi:NADH dehydrogenase